MRYRKITAFLASLTVLCGLCSCGKSGTSSDNDSAVSGTTAASTETASSDSGNADNATEGTTSASQESSSEAGAADSTEASTSADIEVTTEAATTSASSGGDAPTTTTKNPDGGSSQTTTEPPTEAPTEAPTEDKTEYTAKIKLGSTASSSGDNVTIDGSTVKITGSGVYHISGSASQGQIIVSIGTNAATEDKIKLVLDGITLSNSNGPAIFIDRAKRCTLELVDGTVSTLKDGGSDLVNDGAVFSNDTLRIKGNGTLNITSGNAHGIASHDDFILESGNVNITSVKSGVFAHDDISIEGGTLNVKGGTNGLKSEGTVTVKGGKTVVSSGTKKNDFSVYNLKGFVYSGGTLIAAGNQIKTVSSTATPYAIATISDSAEAGKKFTASVDGKEIASVTPHASFKTVIVLAPTIKEGSTMTVDIDGEKKDFTMSNGFNELKIG